MHGIGITFGVGTDSGVTAAEQREREAQAKAWFTPEQSVSPGSSPSKSPGFLERLFDAISRPSEPDYLYSAEAYAKHLRKQEALAAKDALQKPKL